MTDQYLWNMDYAMTRLLHEMIINMVDDLAYTSDVLGKQKIDSAIIRQFAEEDLLSFRNWEIFYLGNRIGANYPSVNAIKKKIAEIKDKIEAGANIRRAHRAIRHGNGR